MHVIFLFPKQLGWNLADKKLLRSSNFVEETNYKTYRQWPTYTFDNDSFKLLNILIEGTENSELSYSTQNWWVSGNRADSPQSSSGQRCLPAESMMTSSNGNFFSVTGP